MIETSFGVKTLRNIGLLGEIDSNEASLLYSESGNTIDDHHSEYSRKSKSSDTASVWRHAQCFQITSKEVRDQAAVCNKPGQATYRYWRRRSPQEISKSLKSRNHLLSALRKKKLWNELQNTKQMLVLLYPITNGTCRILPMHRINQIYSFHACRS